MVAKVSMTTNNVDGNIFHSSLTGSLTIGTPGNNIDVNLSTLQSNVMENNIMKASLSCSTNATTINGSITIDSTTKPVSENPITHLRPNLNHDFTTDDIDLVLDGYIIDG